MKRMRHGLKKSGGWRKVVAVALAAAMTANATGAYAFSDMDGHWSEPYVSDMTAKGYVGGYPDGTVRPDAPITVAEYASILVRAFDLPTFDRPDGSFPDVPSDAWYAPYAYVYGALASMNTDAPFDGDSPITRLETAYALCRLFRFDAPQDDPSSTMADFDTFADDAFARYVVGASLASGLMGGTDRGFEPYKPLTRAELCTVIWRAVEQIGADRAEATKAELAERLGGDASETGEPEAGEPEAGEPEAEEPSAQDQEAENLERFPQEVLKLVNERRAEEGLDPLEWDDKLAEVARKHSEDMAARNFMAHENPDGESPGDR